MAENLILTGPDGTEYTFPGVNTVSIRKSGGGRAEYGSGGGGSNAALLGVLDGSITQLTAQDLLGLTELRENALANLQDLASLEIPEGVTTIGPFCCDNCSALTTVTFPSTLLYIGDAAFYAIPITDVVLGSDVSFIGNGAFWYCTDLATVEISAISPPILGTDVFEGCTSLTAIYVPSASVSAYKTASGWSNYASIIYARP